MLARKTVHEAHVAGEVIAGELQGNKELASAAFNARVIPSVAYTDPEVAWVGLTEDSGLARKASKSRRACPPGPSPAAPLHQIKARTLIGRGLFLPDFPTWVDRAREYA
jgi:hypothetical protein